MLERPNIATMFFSVALLYTPLSFTLSSKGNFNALHYSSSSTFESSSLHHHITSIYTAILYFISYSIVVHIILLQKATGNLGSTRKLGARNYTRIIMVQWWCLSSLIAQSCADSAQPKQVNTKTTKPKIWVGLTETKPKIPKRNLAYISGEFIWAQIADHTYFWKKNY